MLFAVDKFVAALFIFLTSLAIVVYPLKAKRDLHAESFELGEAFASGIFLGVAFFHMLPHSIDLFQQIDINNHYPIAEVICIVSFLFFIFLERLPFVMSNFKSQMSIPYIMTIILVIHSLTEGAVLGIENKYSEAFILFIAIITHKAADSFALCVTLMRYQLPLSRIVGFIILFSLMTPLGIGLGTIMTGLSNAQLMDQIIAVFNAFAAGSFLYIATLHHLRFHPREEGVQVMREYGFLVLGTILMAIIARWT